MTKVVVYPKWTAQNYLKKFTRARQNACAILARIASIMYHITVCQTPEEKKGMIHLWKQ
jgi:hypothetical protein